MRILGFLLAALFLAGCSTTTLRACPQTVRAAGAELDATPLVEALLDWKGTRVQAVNGAWRDRAFQAQCVMKGDGSKLRVVFLAPQLRLVTITVTRPHAVQCERAPQIPDSFEPEYALADLAYVNLDTPTLRRVLAPDLRVEERGDLRRILTAGGEPVAEVVRPATGDWTFRNLEHGYTYTLKTIGN